MSGLGRKHPNHERPTGPTPGLVDPTIELTQPGGHYPYGESLLTDGMGGWTIAPTLRPYYLSFVITTPVEKNGTLVCEHQGVACDAAGPVVMSIVNLIGISVSVGAEIKPKRLYQIEVFCKNKDIEVIGTLRLADGRRAFRRDLSVEIAAGSQLGVRIAQLQGRGRSVFSSGIVMLELEG